MGEPEMEPCEHSRERHGSDARCLRRHSWATLGNPLHHCRAHSVALLRRATRPRPWPCLALLLIAARLNISACDAVQKRDAGLPLRRNLKEDDSREWHDRLASSLEEPQEYGVELPGQHTHRRKLTDVPWVGRRRWHVLSMKGQFSWGRPAPGRAWLAIMSSCMQELEQHLLPVTKPPQGGRGRVQFTISAGEVALAPG